MGTEIRHLTLQDVCEVITDGAHFSPKEDSEGLPMASVKDLSRFGVNVDGCRRIGQEDFSNLVKQGCSPRLGDVLIAKDGNSALDTVCVYRQADNIVLLSSVAILRPNKNIITSDYLNYYLDSPPTRNMLKEGYRSGSAIPRVVLKDFRRAPIPIPSLATQEKIGYFFRTLDDKIELNRQMNRTLEQMARALFKSWFVDFDPVRAKMRGEVPEGMDAETAALFPDELVEIGTREVPKGWTVQPISNLCENIQNGATPRRLQNDFWNKGTINWFKTGELTESFLFGSEEKITSTALKETSVKLWPAGTVLIAIYAAPTVGRLGILTQPSTSNQACSALVPKLEFGSYYIWHTLFEAREWLNTISVGAAQQNISKAVIENVPAVVPSQRLMDVFQQQIGYFWENRRSLQIESVQLTHLRDALLPRLLSGEVDVENWEAASEHPSGGQA